MYEWFKIFRASINCYEIIANKGDYMNNGSFTKSPVQKNHLLIALLLFCGMFLLTLSSYANTPETATANTAEKVHPNPGGISEAQKKQLSDHWGIEVTALRLTAADSMIDFRYRVLDKDKAAPLHKRQTKPYLVHASSGKVLAVPATAKVGPLRNSYMPQQDRIYWMFFGNSGVVKQGDKVSIVIGDFKAENLVIE